MCRRAKLLMKLKAIARALYELDEHELMQRTTEIGVAPGVRPVMVAYLVVLLKLPDTDLPR